MKFIVVGFGLATILVIGGIGINGIKEGKEWSIKDTREFKTKKYKNVEIRYFDEQEAILPVIEEDIDTAIERSKEFFPDLKIGMVKVMIHRDEESFGADINTTAAYYNNYTETMNFHVKNPLTGILINSIFRSQFIHEFSHHVVKKAAKKNSVYRKIPSWFDEGLAEQMSREGYSIDPVEDFIELSELEKVKEFNKEAEGRYNQSYLTVNHIIKRFGDESIGAIIKELENNSFEEAFKIVTGIELEVFEKEVKSLKVENKISKEEWLKEDERLDRILKYLEKDPKNASGYEIAATMYWGKNQGEKAIEILKRGIKFNETFELWNLLSIIYEEQGNIELSKNAEDKAKKLK